MLHSKNRWQLVKVCCR